MEASLKWIGLGITKESLLAMHSNNNGFCTNTYFILCPMFTLTSSGSWNLLFGTIVTAPSDHQSTDFWEVDDGQLVLWVHEVDVVRYVAGGGSATDLFLRHVHELVQLMPDTRHPEVVVIHSFNLLFAGVTAVRPPPPEWELLLSALRVQEALDGAS
jgi:hypothetical protein